MLQLGLNSREAARESIYLLLEAECQNSSGQGVLQAELRGDFALK